MPENNKNDGNQQISNKMKVLEIAGQLKETGLITPITKRLLLAAIANPDFSNLSALINYTKSHIEAVKNTTSPFPKPNIDDDIDGKIRLGTTETGLSCGLNTDDQHCMIAGITGSGKSVMLLYIILAQLLKKEE